MSPSLFIYLTSLLNLAFPLEHVFHKQNFKYLNS